MAKKAAKKAAKGKIIRKKYAIPARIFQKVNKWVYTEIYKDDPKDSIVLQVLMAHQKRKTSLSEIVYILRIEHAIHRKPEALKNMAINCEIPFTE